MTYAICRPLHKIAKTLPVWESLEVLCAYAQLLQHKVQMPASIEVKSDLLVSPSHQPWPWELELLVREVLLRGSIGPGRATLRRASDFGAYMNTLRDVDNRLAVHYSKDEQHRALLVLYRIIHKQLPWQRPWQATLISRYARIFGSVGVDRLIRERTGFGTQELQAAGLLACSGVLAGQLQNFANAHRTSSFYRRHRRSHRHAGLGAFCPSAKLVQAGDASEAAAC